MLSVSEPLWRVLALTLNYLGILPTVPHLFSPLEQTILSDQAMHRTVTRSPNTPGRRFPRLPDGDSKWLTQGVFREKLGCSHVHSSSATPLIFSVIHRCCLLLLHILQLPLKHQSFRRNGLFCFVLL